MAVGPSIPTPTAMTRRRVPAPGPTASAILPAVHTIQELLQTLLPAPGERVRPGQLPGRVLSHLDRGLRAAHRGGGAVQRPGAQAAPAPAAGGAPGVAAVDRGLRLRPGPHRGDLPLLVRDCRRDASSSAWAPSSGSASSTSRPSSSGYNRQLARARATAQTRAVKQVRWTRRPRSGRASRAAAADRAQVRRRHDAWTSAGSVPATVGQRVRPAHRA